MFYRLRLWLSCHIVAVSVRYSHYMTTVNIKEFDPHRWGSSFVNTEMNFELR